MQANSYVAMIIECFGHCDKERKDDKQDNKKKNVRSGYLNKEELKWAITALLGSTPTKLVLVQMFDELRDVYPDVKVQKDRFVGVLMDRLLNVDIMETFRRWFKAFDRNGQGFISFEDFKQACADIAPHMPLSVVHQLFCEADINRDGIVSFNDFERMMIIAST
ncbi:hypothetical protein THRCLA_01185 [Thraustotheca clavata]|uniref:EF-hand domain-containing protein n=1 Tax=Thraustotheca clavata TaxID=74557 RepID=A0A1W0A9D9_9STRA|nr:hypothetical protein THRCLA_01185 [Thraustotheca clavata]